MVFAIPKSLPPKEVIIFIPAVSFRAKYPCNNFLGVLIFFIFNLRPNKNELLNTVLQTAILTRTT